jgi:uncharacterized protein YoxC
MIQIILGIAAVAFITYNVYTTNKLQTELVEKNAIIAALQAQVESLLAAKSRLLKSLEATSKQEKPAIFSKKKASAKV